MGGGVRLGLAEEVWGLALARGEGEGEAYGGESEGSWVFCVRGSGYGADMSLAKGFGRVERRMAWHGMALRGRWGTKWCFTSLYLVRTILYEMI